FSRAVCQCRCGLHAPFARANPGNPVTIPEARVRSRFSEAKQMMRSARRPHHAKLCLEFHRRAASKLPFEPSQGFEACPQRRRLSARADTLARSVRVIEPVEIGSTGKTNARQSAGVMFVTIAIHGLPRPLRLQQENSSPEVPYFDAIGS